MRLARSGVLRQERGLIRVYQAARERQRRRRHRLASPDAGHAANGAG